MKNNKILTFKDRKLLASKYHEWCYRTNALNSIENVIAYLEINGLLDYESCEFFLYGEEEK